jgi:hypothetical protein
MSRVFGFAQKVIMYPLALLATSVAKRMSWPLLQQRGLGLVGSPYRVDKISVVQTPTRMGRMFEYLSLPEHLVEKVLKDRSSAVKEQLDRLFNGLRTAWSIESFIDLFAESGQPGLVHSAYYGYLEDKWVINVIADRIARDDAERSEDISRVEEFMDYDEKRWEQYENE